MVMYAVIGISADSSAVRCDVSRDDDVAELARRGESELGPAGIVMNNAGVVLRGAIEQIELADWQWCLGINLFGVIRGIHAFLPGMIARRHGYIVNTGSMAGMVAFTGEGGPYIASKFGLTGFSTFVEARVHYVFQKENSALGVSSGNKSATFIPITFGIIF